MNVMPRTSWLSLAAASLLVAASAFAAASGPSPTDRFVAVSAGGFHTCAIRGDGTLGCWGAGMRPGTCGRNDGETSCGQAIPPPGQFIQVAAGWRHTCALREDGTVACWGANEAGQATPPPGTFKQIDAGRLASCGLRTDETLTCWGDLDRLPGGTFADMSEGATAVCGLRSDGTIACSRGKSAPPGHFTQVAVGDEHVCGLRDDGAVACVSWSDPNAICGPVEIFDGATRQQHRMEQHHCGQERAPSGRFIAIAAGGAHTCAVREEDHAPLCWGAGTRPSTSCDDASFRDCGQSLVPKLVVRQLSAGVGHTCAVRDDGTLSCWGRDTHGQVSLSDKDGLRADALAAATQAKEGQKRTAVAQLFTQKGGIDDLLSLATRELATVGDLSQLALLEHETGRDAEARAVAALAARRFQELERSRQRAEALRDALKVAEALCATGDFDGCREVARQFSSSAEAPRALLALVRAKLSQGQREEALAEIRSPAARATLNATSWSAAQVKAALGRILEENGAHHEALAMLDGAAATLSAVAESGPESQRRREHIASEFQLARAYADVGEPRKALDHYKRANRLDPRHEELPPDAGVYQALAEHALKKDREALKTLDLSVRDVQHAGISRQQVEAYGALASAYRTLGSPSAGEFNRWAKVALLACLRHPATRRSFEGIEFLATHQAPDATDLQLGKLLSERMKGAGASSGCAALRSDLLALVHLHLVAKVPVGPAEAQALRDLCGARLVP